MIFGAEIRAITVPPALLITRQALTNLVVVSTADSSWHLTASEALLGPYTPVAGDPFGQFVIPPLAQTNHQFFQLDYRANP
jgi:hypothetical protein